MTANAHLLVTAIFAVARAVVYGEDVSASLAAGGAAVASEDTVADGVTIAFLAAPPENYGLAGWTNNGVEVCVGQNPCLLAANADLSVRAEFVSLLRTVDIRGSSGRPKRGDADRVGPFRRDDIARDDGDIHRNAGGGVVCGGVE